MPLLEKVEIAESRLPPHSRGISSAVIVLTSGEKRVLRKRKYIAPSEWAEKHRVVTKSAIPGRWRNDTVPYLAGIIDASFFRSVRKIIMCASPQSGKSEAVNNCIAYAIDRRPGDVLYVYPDELTARDNSRDRILPMIMSSPVLKNYLTGKDDDEAVLRISLKHMQIYMAWANSASRLANKPLPYVVCDEVDKYPVTAGPREASPISLAEKRTTTYSRKKKIWIFSTPTVESGPVWWALTHEASAVFHLLVKCPECGHLQKMELDRIRVPKEIRDPKEILEKKIARYACCDCDAMWDDTARDQAVRKHVWVEKDSGLVLNAALEQQEPVAIAFHLPAWYSPFVSLSEVMSAWFTANPAGQRVNKTELRNFYNGYAALPWVEYHMDRDEQRILALKDDRPRGRVPGGGTVACLTAAADTQDDGFWYEIRAWGWGGDETKKDSWSVREGFVVTFPELERVLFSDEYLDTDGHRYPVRFVLQDALGHRTAEVYDFCRRHRGRVFPTIGRQRLAQPFAWSTQEYYPGAKKPIPGGLKAVIVNTKHFKDELARLLEITAGDPSAFRFNADFPDAYASHYVAEFTNDKGEWECPPNKANHLWDCSVLNLVAHEILGVQHWKRPGEATAEKPKQVEQTNNDKVEPQTKKQKAAAGGRW
jgi:phage terminase large subunit GpA-like protein